MNLEALIEEAGKATAPKVHKYADLWPAFATLRSRGFTHKTAVVWLIQKGQIAKEDERRALDAFAQIATRKNKQSRK
jgi:hypothetical protein